MKEQFEYSLKLPISVSSDGVQSDETEIVVSAPKPRDRERVLVLESYVMKSVLNISGMSDTNSKTSDGSEGDSVEATELDKINQFKTIVFGMAEEKNIVPMINTFRDLMCSGNKDIPQSTIGGTKFTKPLFDEIGHLELNELIARYVVYFLSIGSM